MQNSSKGQMVLPVFGYVVEKIGILSRCHGGGIKGRWYCRYWRDRPAHIERKVLCSGGGYWPPCPDYDRCGQNKPIVVPVNERIAEI